VRLFVRFEQKGKITRLGFMATRRLFIFGVSFPLSGIAVA